MLIESGTVVPDAADMTHAEAARALFTKASVGDEDAASMVREIGRYVGYGCVTIFNGYNPEHIIIGDIVAEAGPMLLDEVRAIVAERAIPEINAATSITLSTLPTDAAVSGAAAVAVTQFLGAPLGVLRRLLTGAPSEISIRNRTTTRKQRKGNQP